MQMRPEIQIQSAVKALTDVVLPAIEPGNKLAQEQVRLAIGLLGLMAKQLPLQFRYDCDELARLLGLAESLKQQTTVLGSSASAVAALSAQSRASQDVLDRAKADPAELVKAVSGLRAATSAIVSEAYESAEAGPLAELQSTVLAMSAEQQLRERAWYQPQGWEPPHVSLPTIETLLGVSAAS